MSLRARSVDHIFASYPPQEIVHGGRRFLGVGESTWQQKKATLLPPREKNKNPKKKNARMYHSGPSTGRFIPIPAVGSRGISRTLKRARARPSPSGKWGSHIYFADRGLSPGGFDVRQGPRSHHQRCPSIGAHDVQKKCSVHAY